MPTNYTAFLGKGQITYRNGIYKGSDHNAVTWSPAPPQSQGGWQAGDTLAVSITLDVDPDVNPQPGANQYAGLCVGACSAADTSTVNALISQAEGLPVPNVGQLLGSNISTSDNPSNSAIFYNAKSVRHTVTLNNGQQLVDYITSWTMTYNASNTVASDGDDVEIVFGYGDPQEADAKT